MSSFDTSEPDDLALRRGYHHGNLREALLEAARRLTAERGPHGFTLAEAARLAGVSASAPYRHFKDKEALLAELCQRGFAAFGVAMREAAQTGGLPAMGPAYLTFARQEPGYYGVMFSWMKPGVGEVETSTSFSGLVGAIARAIPDSVDRETARRLGLEIWAMSHGIAGLERSGWPPPGSGVAPPEEVLKRAVMKLLMNK